MFGVRSLLSASCALLLIFANLVSSAPSLYSLNGKAVQYIQKRQSIGAYPAPGNNDFDCRSAEHPNPVIFLHGAAVNANLLLNVLQANLSNSGYCTFSLTYGEQPFLPGIGGLRPIDESADIIATFITDVHTRTGAEKVDIVGHSEGGLMALYVPKVKKISPIVDKIVAIAPPTHGTTIAGLYILATIGGSAGRGLAGGILAAGGCPACDDFGPGGSAIRRLNDGPIKQEGNEITIIMTRNDLLVTPPITGFIDEDGVNNIFLQDRCPADPSGHVWIVYDTYVWGLVTNALDPSSPLYPCSIGLPV